MASAESLESARSWMEKSAHDLETARLLIRREKRLLDIAVYHCQQTAEKALKACLTANEIAFPKTHSLEDVLDLCLPANPDFEQFRDHCEKLTPLIHEFRYPDAGDQPDLNRAAEALQLAEDVYAFCEQQLAE
jgi:HEPN domain-containing protein